MMSDFRPKVAIWPFRACAMHPALIIGTVRSLWTWLWGSYHVPTESISICSHSHNFSFTYVILLSIRNIENTAVQSLLCMYYIYVLCKHDVKHKITHFD